MATMRLPATMTASSTDPAFPRYNRFNTEKRRAKSVSHGEANQLLKSAVFTQTHGTKGDVITPGTYQTITHTSTREVHVPHHQEMTVPIVRKEVVKAVEQRVVKGTKQVPVTKYKDVQETKLEVRTETVNGLKEKRYVPVTRTRQVPYMEFEEREVEKVVSVPCEKVVTRKGQRLDKYVGTKVLALEQDCVYELRPVLISKGEPRVAEGKKTYLHHGKRTHGDPVWSEELVDGWEGRPLTPAFRPSSASSQMSRAGSTLLRPGSSLNALTR